MNYFLLILSIIFFVIGLHGVIKRYNNQKSFRDLQLYQADLLGLFVGLVLFIVVILRMLGYNIK